MTCELVKFNFPITESKWVTAHLPVQFRIESERFPVNTIDDIDSVASVEEGDGGLALFILAGTYEDYEVGEYVKISNATIGGYDGVFRIVEALYPTELLLEVSFLGNATADLQRYYRNYAIKIDVWAGIPNGHQLQTRRPIERKTEKPLLYRPRTDNIAYVDISDFVRADLPNIDNNLCERVINTDDSTAPDTDLWTSFYIAYSEVWDIVDENGNSVQTNTDTQVLGEQLIEDNQFLTESSPFWTNVTSPDLPEMSAPARFWSRQFNPSPLVNTFVAGIQRPSSGTWSGSFSEYYAQTDIPTVAGKEYRLLIDYFKFAAFASGTTDKIFFYDLTAGTR